MNANLTPWNGDERPSEATLRATYKAEGLSPYAWSNGPGDRYGAHSHSYNKVLYCSQGSITFVVEGRDVLMRPGDRLDLPAGVSHAAVVGPEGCTCLEAHK
jgi:quercetin dioxygenase-like cupin family protein